MAKSIRSKALRRARAEKRVQVFKPVEDARMERLHAKTMERLAGEMALDQQRAHVDASEKMVSDEVPVVQMEIVEKKSARKAAKPGAIAKKTKNRRHQKKPFNFYGL